jgi:tetratricopeptide (TPR) repeat protein
MRWLKKALGKATGRSGRKFAEELVTKGYVATKEGRLDDALEAFRAACEADETLGLAHFDAGATELSRFNRDAPQLDRMTRVARLEAAERWLQRAVQLDDRHAPSWRALARVRERKGALAQARDAWQQVLSLLPPGAGPGAPDDGQAAEARRELARLAIPATLDAVIADAKAALSVPGDDDARQTELRAAGQALWAAWLAAKAAGLQMPAHLHALAGSLARRAGDTSQARELLEAAVRDDHHDIEAWTELATVCMSLGDIQAALSSSMAAYREDPLNAGLVCNVGVCHLALGHTTEAAEFIELASGMAPDDPIVVRAGAALAAARTAEHDATARRDS